METSHLMYSKAWSCSLLSMGRPCICMELNAGLGPKLLCIECIAISLYLLAPWIVPRKSCVHFMQQFSCVRYLYQIIKLQTELEQGTKSMGIAHGIERKDTPVIRVLAWALGDPSPISCSDTDFLCDIGQGPLSLSVPQFTVCNGNNSTSLPHLDVMRKNTLKAVRCSYTMGTAAIYEPQIDGQYPSGQGSLLPNIPNKGNDPTLIYIAILPLTGNI